MGKTTRVRKSITHSLLHLVHSLSHSCLGPACATPRLAPHAGASVHASPHAETLDGPKQPIPAWDHAGAPDPSQHRGKFSGACGRPPRARASSPEQPAPKRRQRSRLRRAAHSPCPSRGRPARRAPSARTRRRHRPPRRRPARQAAARSCAAAGPRGGGQARRRRLHCPARRMRAAVSRTEPAMQCRARHSAVGEARPAPPRLLERAPPSPCTTRHRRKHRHAAPAPAPARHAAAHAGTSANRAARAPRCWSWRCHTRVRLAAGAPARRARPSARCPAPPRRRRAARSPLHAP